MKKTLTRLLSSILVVLIVLLAAPLEGVLELPSLVESIVGNTSMRAFASTNYDQNVSYDPVLENYDNGGFPSGLSYCYENETVYFNFSAGTDVYVRKATYHLSRNGQSNYLTGTRTPENSYFRWCWFSLDLPDGSYSIYWDIEYSAPNYSSDTGYFTTDSYSFTVYNPEIIPSKSTVNLNLDSTKTATIYMTCHGGGSGNYINYTSSTSNCTVSAGDWNNDRMAFTITATSVGSSTLDFNLRTSGNTTVATTSVTVNVTENTYTFSYNANGGSGAPSNQTGAKSYTVSSTVPSYFGKTFLGWSKNSSATSASYTPGNSISLSGNTTLYAVWKSAESLSLGTNKSVTISFANQERYYTFKPSSSGTYSFESTGNLDTKAYLYSSSGSELKNNDDDGEGNNFKLEYDLTSGTTYYLKVRAYSTYTGSSTFAVSKVDTTKPTASLSSTNNVAASQTVTLSMSDNVGIAGYYWGTSSTYSNNTYTSTSSTSTTKTISSAGTYYLTVKDTSGNLSTSTSITFYKTTLNANSGSVSPSSVLTKSGNSFTFPTPTRSGYTYNGWSTSSTATSGVTTLKPTSSTTYYAVWSQVDTTKPTASLSSTNNVAASQTVTLSMSDNVGIAGYYWGTSSTYSNNAYTSTSSTSTTKTVSSAGTYYLTVKDASGNVSTTASITFYKTTLNANGGSVSPSSVLTKSGNSFALPTPTRSGYSVKWNTKSDGTGTDYSTGSSYKPTSSLTLYAKWAQVDSTKPTASLSSTNNVAASQTVTLSMSDNVGIAGYYWGTSSTYSNNAYTSTSSTSTTKTVSSAGTYYLTVKDASGNVSTTASITFYKTTLNANGGLVSPSSVLTKSGNFFTFPTPTRSSYTYNGWSTSSNATSGVKTLKPTSDATYYATWTAINIYNLGEETYSFMNFDECNSSCSGSGGHCFGMAVTSSGYHLGCLSKSIFGGKDAQSLYSYSFSDEIQKPICHYFRNQGSTAEYPSMVAGGRINLDETIDWVHINPSTLKKIAEQDWNECVKRVKNHEYDGKGSLNIGMYYYGEDADFYIDGGHQVNFLYYKEVNGQHRIYAYDNNLPGYEVYYYYGSDGFIHEKSDESIDEYPSNWVYQLISGDLIVGFDLMDVNMDLSRKVQSKNTQRSFALEERPCFPQWSVAERRKTWSCGGVRRPHASQGCDTQPAENLPDSLYRL